MNTIGPYPSPNPENQLIKIKKTPPNIKHESPVYMSMTEKRGR